MCGLSTGRGGEAAGGETAGVDDGEGVEAGGMRLAECRAESCEPFGANLVMSEGRYTRGGV